MVIELKGINNKNKGAYLMLESIKDQLKEYDLCAEHDIELDYYSISQMKLFQKINLKSRFIPYNFLFHKLNYDIKKKYGFFTNKDVDLIIDASGFAYADFWGPKVVEYKLGDFIKNKYKKNTKLILLPQAFGPFNDIKLKESFESIVDKATLIFARDLKSYDYLISAYGKRENIKLYPDFTNILDVGEPVEYSEGNICIIPNSKMLVGGENNKKNYYDFLIKIIEKFNKDVYFLIHEGIDDINIAKDINELLESKIPIVIEDSPIVIKRRIKSSKFVITSRYHGLISALSQGIPCLTTSWSHKYLMVLEDYNLKDCLIDINNVNWNNIDDFIQLNLYSSENFINNQKKYIDQEKSKTIEMWGIIKQYLKNK